MPHDFEKNYPLPFRAHVFQEKLLKKPKTLMVYARNGYYIFSSRIENRFDVFKYMVSCANLMPEAAEALKTAQGALEAVKSSPLCNFCSDISLCEICDVRIALDKVASVLAKLEGATVNEKQI
ncbi:hypothetical protein [Cloacibacillus evryensis]|uniref:hypothetical protein n=1 Tax=Cloacibacillus evryensis TaxID=508460 RepID=UPI0004AFFC6E|nr:hypothetical protein [Cloacibacillus evryensis]MEA5034010.1 hypothetical protein [Cloacibacillus evryensis]